MSVCKSCMLTGMLSAIAAGTITAVVLSSRCQSSRNLHNSVNHAVKSLTHAMEDML